MGSMQWICDYKKNEFVKLFVNYNCDFVIYNCNLQNL